MQRYIDTRRVKRRRTFGLVLTISGLVLMLGAVAASFLYPAYITIIFGASLIGLLVSQTGRQVFDRWGRSPRIDEVLDAGLKGLDGRYATFHYALGASHALFCPSGIFALCTSDIDGKIEYTPGKWLRTPAKPSRFRPSGPRPLAEPARQTASEVAALQRTLAKHFKREEAIPVQPILVFLHPNADVEAASAPFAAVHVKKLKAHLRSLPKGDTLSAEEVRTLARAVGLQPGDDEGSDGQR
jgi:hypothetical protein